MPWRSAISFKSFLSVALSIFHALLDAAGPAPAFRVDPVYISQNLLLARYLFYPALGNQDDLIGQPEYTFLMRDDNDGRIIFLV
jgi:hypothetical protein